MSAVQAEAAELHKAFKAQGAAVQATKAFINSVDEKLTKSVLDTARAADAAAASASSSWERRHSEHRVALERLLAWESAFRASEEQAKQWRASVDESLKLSEQRSAAIVASAQTILEAGRLEMAEATSKCQTGVRELEQRWPEWVSELQTQMTSQDARKADKAEASSRFDELEARLSALVSKVDAATGRAANWENFDEIARALGKLTTEHGEMRTVLRSHRQQVHSHPRPRPQPHPLKFSRCTSSLADDPQPPPDLHSRCTLCCPMSIVGAHT